MTAWIIVSFLLGFSGGRVSKHSHETVIIEKSDGSTEVRESKPGEVQKEKFIIHRDIWGDVTDIQKK